MVIITANGTSNAIFRDAKNAPLNSAREPIGETLGGWGRTRAARPIATIAAATAKADRADEASGIQESCDGADDFIGTLIDSGDETEILLRDRGLKTPLLRGGEDRLFFFRVGAAPATDFVAGAVTAHAHAGLTEHAKPYTG